MTNHQPLHTTLLALLLLLLLPPALHAQRHDYTDEEMQTIQQYYELFNQPDRQEEFLQLNERIKEMMQKRQDRLGYYTFCINEITYEINRHRTNTALKKAEAVLDEMLAHQDGHFDMIYNTMSTIYEDRGNYKMAQYYSRKAIDMLAPGDTVGAIGAYLGMANLEASVHPDQSISLIARTLPLCQRYPTHYIYALTIKALACYFKGDGKTFRETRQQYDTFCRDHQLDDERSDSIVATIDAVFSGHWQHALSLINNKQYYSENLGYYDMLIQFYRLKGDKDMVISHQQKKLEAIDSLNANLIYENMNEMNAEMEVFKTQRKAARERELWFMAVIALLVVGIGLIVWRYLTRRAYQRRLLKKNQELEVALDRAQESDRMKTSFIEHVSHEIRTPLNVITGFAQVITNPDYELEDEERNTMLSDISRNTIEITNIVNELLELAQDESREHYEREDDVNVAQLCQEVMDKAATLNNGRLALNLRNQLDEGFTLRTNAAALRKVLNQLMKNALKFTRQGSVELRVRERAANGGVEFSVTDTGVGIAEEHHEKVFERFYKVDSFKQGLGLGLTMARKIAELLGGTLDIDATYKKGARFLLVLPVHGA